MKQNKDMFWITLAMTSIYYRSLTELLSAYSFKNEIVLSSTLLSS